MPATAPGADTYSVIQSADHNIRSVLDEIDDSSPHMMHVIKPANSLLNVAESHDYAQICSGSQPVGARLGNRANSGTNSMRDMSANPGFSNRGQIIPATGRGSDVAASLNVIRLESQHASPGDNDRDESKISRQSVAERSILD